MKMLNYLRRTFEDFFSLTRNGDRDALSFCKRVASIILIINGLLSFSARASENNDALDPDETFSRANLRYNAARYDSAIKEDESILETGLRSGNIYYNLGNFYFKRGELGEAILNYERARRLIPRDSDLLSNYRYVRSLMKQQDVPEKRLWILQVLDRAMRYVTLKQAITITTVIYYLLIFVVILTKVFKKCRNYSTIIIIVLCLAMVVLLIPLSHRIAGEEQEAVITTRIIDARFEPEKNATVNFPLYEGMKVRVLRTYAGWYKIKRPDGKIGWIEDNSAGLISVPPNLLHANRLHQSTRNVRI